MALLYLPAGVHEFAISKHFPLYLNFNNVQYFKYENNVFSGTWNNHKTPLYLASNSGFRSMPSAYTRNELVK